MQQLQEYFTDSYSSQRGDFEHSIPYRIYWAEEADAALAAKDARIELLKWEHDQIEGMQRDIKAKLEARIAELEKALTVAMHHLPMAQLLISHCKDYALIRQALKL